MSIELKGNLTLVSLILFGLFLILKLTHVITWSWLWVLAPLWLPVILTGVMIVLCCAIVLFITAKG